MLTYYLVVAIMLVGMLCIFDLVLSLGVIRRLREHDELLRRFVGGTEVATGQRVGAFAARTTGGDVVSREAAYSHRLVGFFSPGCAPCAALIPEFCAYGTRHNLAGLAVVVSAGDENEPSYVSQLSTYADVVVEGSRGQMSAAFRVDSYPALFLIDANGTVLAGGTAISDLSHLVPTLQAI